MLLQQMDIPGTDGRYFVKIDGTVWRRWKKAPPTLCSGTRKGRKIEYKISDGTGRCHVMTASCIMKKTYFAHLPSGTSLRHINGLVEDYAVWNLQPMTKAQLGRMCNRRNDAKSVCKCNAETGEVLEFYPSARAAGRANFCSYQTILDACNRKNVKRCGIAPDGYEYRWEER